jgi:citrate lyase subunit beta/citryl-CoA lyase
VPADNGDAADTSDLAGAAPVLASAVSWLFVPGDRPERFAKAASSGAHVVVCDLEDAVAPEAKAGAREHVADYLHDGGRAVVRINGATTAWHADDLAALARAPGLLAVMLPKAEGAGAVRAVADAAGAPVVALVESALGVVRVHETAAAAARLAFGSLDFALDVAADHDDDGALLQARTTLVLASRAAGLPSPVDGVTTALDDASAAARDAARARRLGFGGKLCIHPRQIAAVHAAYTPTEDELAWARDVLAASADGSSGAVRSSTGELIDAPVVRRARAILMRGPA